MVNVSFITDTLKENIKTKKKQKNTYSENSIDRCFKLFLNQIHILKEKVPTVEKNPLQFYLNYLQTRTKLQKSIKEILNCCKLWVIFKS